MLIKQIFLAFMGASFGLLVSGGVFTVLIAVGLVPRFAGKTHTSNKVLLYEEMVVAGTLIGNVLSVFGRSIHISDGILQTNAWLWIGNSMLAVFGIFAGMFVGCLALAIAEMLDSIPISARRVSFRHGIGIVVLAMALGKITGSLIYFSQRLFKS